MCNPPFHHSKEDALLEAISKWRKLNGNKKPDKTLNFGGQANEVSRPGGEMQFLFDLIYESTRYKNQFLWFTSLVAKQQHMPAVLRELKLAKATQTRTINMSHGNKISRIVAWTFQSPAQLEHWFARPL
jgi:23S rRNA (adenine1618-N6)-methyltransferase